jgi:hypothetical protein
VTVLVNCDDFNFTYVVMNRVSNFMQLCYVISCKKYLYCVHMLSGSHIRRVFNVSLGILLAYLSIPIVQNLLSSRQVMNTSFDPLRLVNTYGAFGRLDAAFINSVASFTFMEPLLHQQWKRA